MNIESTENTNTKQSIIKKHGNLCKTIVFLLILVFIVGIIAHTFKNGDYRAYQTFYNFREEPDNEVDIVYIGASGTYAMMSAPLAWKDYHVRSYVYALPNLQPYGIKGMIKEARKTQPNAVYIVTLNAFKKDNISEATRAASVHYTVDYMPWSLNKIETINKMAESAGFTGKNKLEFYLPFYRFHSRWATMNTLEDDAFIELNGYKSGSFYMDYLYGSANLNYSFYNDTDIRLDMPEEVEADLLDIIDYCKENDVKLGFLITPQAINDISNVALMNTAKDIVEAAGYPCFDYFHQLDEVGLNLQRDFYNTLHTNIHGAIKCTNHATKAIMDYFQLEPVPNDEEHKKSYESWDQALEKYSELIEAYALDFELNHEERDYTMKAPEVNLRRDGTDFIVRWTEADESNIDGYLIYRKMKDAKAKNPKGTKYELIGKTEKGNRKLIDRDIVEDMTYSYIVVPYRMEDGRMLYGDTDYSASSAKTITEGPVLLDVYEDELDGGVHLTWEEYPDATSYTIYRRMCGQEETFFVIEYIKQEDKRKPLDTEYVDYSTMDGVSYVYSVSANYNDPITEKTIATGYRKKGLLLYRETDTSDFNPTISLSGASVLIQWDKVLNADYYHIYKQKGDQWELVFGRDEFNDMLNKRKREGTLNAGLPYAFVDSKSTEKGTYTYRVVPVIANGYDDQYISLADVKVSIKK